jgi:hypothetical protein
MDQLTTRVLRLAETQGGALSADMPARTRSLELMFGVTKDASFCGRLWPSRFFLLATGIGLAYAVYSAAFYPGCIHFYHPSEASGLVFRSGCQQSCQLSVARSQLLWDVGSSRTSRRCHCSFGRIVGVRLFCRLKSHLWSTFTHSTASRNSRYGSYATVRRAITSPHHSA